MKIKTMIVRSFAAASVTAMMSAQVLQAEVLTILHVGDQESWLLSAQGNLRDDASQSLSFYGGVDRLSTVLADLEQAASQSGDTVLKLNAGDAWLPGPRFNASLDNLQTAAADGGQDYYDAIAMRQIGFDATVFGNHEFDLGLPTATRFTDVATSVNTPYLSFNIDFSKDTGLSALAAANKVAPYALYSTNGGKTVAVIGVTTPLLPFISSTDTLPLMDGFRGFNAANSELQNINALATDLQSLITDLRTNQGVDVVILLSHLQNFEREVNDLIPQLTGVDLVVSGGGHELQTNASSTTIPTTSPVFGPALPNPPINYPTFATDAANNDVPVVTANFGNRYVGTISLDINPAIKCSDILHAAAA